MRNFMATLLLSQGTPMILGGDEFGWSKGGNNNAYCQDNEINWLDWATVDDEGRALADFLRRLIAIRQSSPLLGRSRFFTGRVAASTGGRDITWVKPTGEEMSGDDWQDGRAKCLGVILDGRAGPASRDAIMIVVNSHHDVVIFTLPAVAGGIGWTLLVDTNSEEPGATDPGFAFDHDYLVTGRSLLLFELQSGAALAEATAQPLEA